MITPVASRARTRSGEELMQLIGRGQLDTMRMTSAEEAALWLHARKRVEALQSQICNQLQGPENTRGGRKARQLLRKLITSKAARLHALRLAQIKVPQASRSPLAACIALLDQVDPHARQAEPRSTWFKAKPNSSGTRRLNSFEHVDRACQTLVRLGLEPFARACPTRSCHPGQVLTFGGTPNACDALREALRNAPASACFLHLDIRSFFDRVAAGALGEITGLPPEIIHNQVALVLRKKEMTHVAPSLRMISVEKVVEAHSPSTSDLPGAVPTDGVGEHGFPAKQADRRRSLPQGSAVSPIVAEMVIGRVLRDIGDLPPHLFFRVYSDNVGVLTSSREEALAFYDFLQRALARHKAGPFSTTHKITAISRPFIYLGHRWVRGANGRVTADPGLKLHGWQQRFMGDMMLIQGCAGDRSLDATASAHLVRLFRSVASFAGGFPAWQGLGRGRWVQRHQDMALQLLAEHCQSLDLDPAQLDGAAQLSQGELALLAGAEERALRRASRRAAQSAARMARRARGPAKPWEDGGWLSQQLGQHSASVSA